MVYSIFRSFRNFCIVLFLISPLITKAQSSLNSSPNLKKGTFNYYPKDFKTHFLTQRNRDFQIETNSRTGDTLLLKINWINDYSYTLKYLTGSGKTASKMPSFLKRNTFTYQIVKITNDLYFQRL
jgi:hypothetical protein